MNTELEILQDEMQSLKTHNNEIMAIINSDSPLTHKIKAMLEQPKIRNEFLALLPDAGNREQILRAEIQSMAFDIMQSNELQQCTPQSFLFCLKDSLSRGLRIGSIHKEAWLIKFISKKKGENGLEVFINEAKIMVGYRAYINKAWNENKTRFVVGTITKEEVQYVIFDRSEGKLEINIPLGKETKLHTKENIEYVYVTSIADNGNKWSDLYTKEAIEEKSKIGKWENKNKIYGLGKVWNSSDRLTDYKEMLQKGAIIAFSKMLPSRGLNELANFDHRQLESIKDITPPKHNQALSDPASAINEILNRKTEERSTDDNMEDVISIITISEDETDPLSNRTANMYNRILDKEPEIGKSVEFKNLMSDLKVAGDKDSIGMLNGAFLE